MALSLDSVIKYIPEFAGERERWAKGENPSPLTFHIKAMGAAPFRSFAAKLSQFTDDGDSKATEGQVMKLYREVVGEHVIKVENLTVDGVSIQEGAAFYDHPAMPNDLVLEIEKAIVEMNQVSEGDAKN